jgi:large subunit ribosomal protein L22
MKATLTNYRQSPRKVRLVADAMKGKSVAAAQMELRFMVKRAALPLEKLLESAVANAVNGFGMSKDNLFIKEFTVDKGIVLKRSMPRAFGRASGINKRSSHVTIVLAEKADMKASKKEAAKNKTVEVKAVKKVPAKKTTKKAAK